MQTNQLDELRHLLFRDPVVTGTVVSTDGGLAQVATGRGVVSASVGTLVIRTGDVVRLQGESVLGKVKDAGALPAFDL